MIFFKVNVAAGSLIFVLKLNAIFNICHLLRSLRDRKTFQSYLHKKLH